MDQLSAVLTEGIFIDRLGHILQDWRFPAGVMFLGTIVGHLVFKMTPLPRGAQVHAEPLVRAGVVRMIASRIGRRDVETFADLVGVHELATIARHVRRQRRLHLALGLGIGTIALLPTYMLAPVSMIPDWVFASMGAAGIYSAWKLW